MKKQGLIALLAALASLNVYANTYVGGSLGFQDISANSSKFRGWRPGLFIGYGGRMSDDDDNYYLAGELAVSWASETSDQYINRRNSLRMSPELSLSLLPGMILKPDLLGYLRFGAGEAKQKIPNVWVANAIVGAGLEYAMTPCWSLRGEYNYTFFASTNIGNPRSHDLILSLKYTYDE